MPFPALSRGWASVGVAAVVVAATGAALALPVAAAGPAVRPQPSATTTTLTVSPPGGVREGEPLTLTAVVAPAQAVGVVQFFAGGTLLGTVGVEGGTAVLTSAVPPGTTALQATFVPGPVLVGSVGSTLVTVVPPTPDVGVLPTAEAAPPAGAPPAGAPPATRAPAAVPQAASPAPGTGAAGDLPFSGLPLVALLTTAGGLLVCGALLARAKSPTRAGRTRRRARSR